MSGVNALIKAAPEAARALRAWIPGLIPEAGFIQTVKTTLGGGFKAASTALTESPLAAFNAIADNKLGASGITEALTTLAISAPAYGYSMLDHAGSALQDQRRLFNMSNNGSDPYTPVDAALNTSYMSLAGTVLSAVPFFGGLSKLAGKGLLTVGKNKGSAWAIGSALSLIGKSAGWMTDGFLFTGKVAGKAIDLPLRLFGLNTNFAGYLGKQYLWTYGLMPARAAYKYFQIDLSKNPNTGIAAWMPGGTGLVIDTDPSSPTYLLSRMLEPSMKRRSGQQVPGHKFGEYLQGAFSRAHLALS